MPNASKYETYKNSGSEWLGDIPASWPMVLLSQIATQVKNKNSDLTEKNLLSLSYGRIKRKPIDTSSGLLPASFDGYNIIEANDIVLRLTDLQNDHTSLRVGLSAERGIITSAYTTMRPKNTNGAKYLYYLLHTFDIRKGFYGMGSGVRQGLNYDEVKRLKLPLPTDEDQIAIATFLDSKITHIDSIISEAKASIEEYKAWKASIIYEAVTKGLDPNVEMKDSGVEWIGEIPYNWAIIKTARAINFTQNGLTRRDLVASKGQIVLKLKNISADGVLDYSTTNRIELSENELATYVLQEGDFLFVRVNGSRNLVGKCAIFSDIGEPAAYNDHIIRVRLNEIIEKEYLFWYLLSDAGKREIELHTSTAAGQFTISGSGLRDIYVTLPPITEQQQICKYLIAKTSPIDRIIEEKDALISDLEAYKKSLIFEVVTGKRRVC